MEKALLYFANGEVKEIFPGNGHKSFSLDEMQSIVKGPIDIQELPKQGAVMILNDCGKLEGLPFNKAASEIWQKNYPINEYPHNNDGVICGDVLICPIMMIQ